MTDLEILVVLLVLLVAFIPFYLVGLALSVVGLLRKYLKRKIELTDLEIQSLYAELNSYREDAQ